MFFFKLKTSHFLHKSQGKVRVAHPESFRSQCLLCGFCLIVCSVACSTWLRKVRKWNYVVSWSPCGWSMIRWRLIIRPRSWSSNRWRWTTRNHVIMSLELKGCLETSRAELAFYDLDWEEYDLWLWEGRGVGGWGICSGGWFAFLLWHFQKTVSTFDMILMVK